MCVWAVVSSSNSTICLPSARGSSSGFFFNHSVMAQMFVCLQNLCVEILNPSVLALGGGAFGRCWGHEGGTPMIGINVLVKETPECSLVPPTMWGHSEMMAIYESGRGFSPPDTESAGTLSWTSQPPEQWEINFYVEVIQLVILVIAAQMDYRMKPIFSHFTRF